MIAYFDCFSGISGNMCLGAFIDLGVPVPWLMEQLTSLPLSGFDISVKETRQSGIGAKCVEVLLRDETTSRHYNDIKSLLEKSPLDPGVRNKSLEAFEKLADAESAIHQCPKETVHFHEVGGIDAIVDIVGSALGMAYLGIDEVISSHLPLGSGSVECCHGVLPVPAPATLAILKNIPVYGGDMPYELVTPTGAAIIATMANAFGPIPEILTEKIGYGAGTRDHGDRPNLLRIILGHRPRESRHIHDDSIIVIETAIDDMNPEIFGYLMDRLFEDGALDVHWSPIYMKKNRPGTMINVLCPQHAAQGVIQRILSETSSLGVRYHAVQRKILQREQVMVETSLGRVEAKRINMPDGSYRIAPEFEAARKVASERGVTLQRVYDAVAHASFPKSEN